MHLVSILLKCVQLEQLWGSSDEDIYTDKNMIIRVWSPRRTSQFCPSLEFPHPSVSLACCSLCKHGDNYTTAYLPQDVMNAQNCTLPYGALI